MGRDTRIAVGLALIYFLNGFINVFGPSKSFLPLVFIDSFLLALLSLVFLILPKFTKFNLIFLFFTISFTLQGLFIVGFFPSNWVEIMCNVIFLGICASLYFYALFQFKKLIFLGIFPMVMFLFSIFFGFVQVPTLWIIIFSTLGALSQVYILARPDLVENLTVTTKRFYLLMTIQVFFDVLSFIFFKINAPGVDFHY